MCPCRAPDGHVMTEKGEDRARKGVDSEDHSKTGAKRELAGRIIHVSSGANEMMEEVPSHQASSLPRFGMASY